MISFSDNYLDTHRPEAARAVLDRILAHDARTDHHVTFFLDAIRQHSQGVKS